MRVSASILPNTIYTIVLAKVQKEGCAHWHGIRKAVVKDFPNDLYGGKINS